MKDFSLPHKIRLRIQSYLGLINSKNAGLFFRLSFAKKGANSQAFLAKTVETGDKNRDESLYTNKSCDEHAFYFRR